MSDLEGTYKADDVDVVIGDIQLGRRSTGDVRPSALHGAPLPLGALCQHGRRLAWVCGRSLGEVPDYQVVYVSDGMRRMSDPKRPLQRRQLQVIDMRPVGDGRVPAGLRAFLRDE